MLALGLLAPTTASAQTCEAPPGISGIEQYCESIQGPGGKAGPGDRGSRGGRVVGGPTARELRGSGPDGRAVLGLTGKNGTGSASGSGGAGSDGDEGGSGASGSKGSGGGSGNGGSKSGAATGGSTSNGGETGSSEGGTDESDDGLLSTLSIASGTGLILILLALTVLLTGMAWVRSRRGGQAEETPGEE